MSVGGRSQDRWRVATHHYGYSSSTRYTGCWKARLLCGSHRMRASRGSRQAAEVGVASVFTSVTHRALESYTATTVVGVE